MREKCAGQLSRVRNPMHITHAAEHLVSEGFGDIGHILYVKSLFDGLRKFVLRNFITLHLRLNIISERKTDTRNTPVT